jgi:hypothetical protein
MDDRIILLIEGNPDKEELTILTFKQKPILKKDMGIYWPEINRSPLLKLSMESAR